MKVSLSKNSWHYRLQKFTYGEEPSKNFYSICPYFWATVIAAVMFPMTVLGALTRGIFDPTQTPEQVAGMKSIYSRYDNTRMRSNLNIGFTTFSAFIVATFFVFAVCLLVFSIGALVTSSSQGAMVFLIGVSIMTFLVVFVKTMELWIPYVVSLFEKVCPIIYWKDES